VTVARVGLRSAERSLTGDVLMHLVKKKRGGPSVRMGARVQSDTASKASSGDLICKQWTAVIFLRVRNLLL